MSCALQRHYCRPGFLIGVLHNSSWAAFVCFHSLLIWSRIFSLNQRQVNREFPRSTKGVAKGSSVSVGGLFGVLSIDTIYWLDWNFSAGAELISRKNSKLSCVARWMQWLGWSMLHL